MTEQKSPWLLLLMGPNGAGKSTFYNNYLKMDPLLKDIPFLNTDIVAAKKSASQNPDIKTLLLSGIEVHKQIQQNLQERKSFIYETTGAGRLALKLMGQAKEQGFQVATIFIGLSKVELSHLRVRQRYAQGGHHVDDKDIERRFPRIMENLPEIIRNSDLSTVFDNSGKKPFEILCMTYDEKNFMVSNHAWLDKILNAEKDSLPPQVNLYRNLKKQDAAQIAFWLGTRFNSFFQR